MLPVLYQFRASHYNEKVRWALDFKGIPHLRRSLLPGPHKMTARRLTGQAQVPILVLDGRALHDSSRIIAELEQRQPDPPLYPADPALRERALGLARYFDDELGPHVRRAFIALALPHTAYFCSVNDAEAPALLRALYRAVYPAFKPAIRRQYGLHAGASEESWKRVEAVLDRLEREIRPGGYLVGGRFTVADLTAAALLGSAMQAPEFPYRTSVARPPEVQALLERFRRREAHDWVRRMYRLHRGASAEVQGATAGPGREAFGHGVPLRRT